MDASVNIIGILLGSSAAKESSCNAGDMGSIPALESYPKEPTPVG